MDKTDELPYNIKEIAVNAVKAIPGLLQGGVDLVVNDDEGVVIEINGTPHTGIHVFLLMAGHVISRKVAIDFYFPGTQTKEGSKRLYFDFDKVVNILGAGVVESIILPNMLQDPISERIIIDNVKNMKK